jgi:hypothetical protein
VEHYFHLSHQKKWRMARPFVLASIGLVLKPDSQVDWQSMPPILLSVPLILGIKLLKTQLRAHDAVLFYHEPLITGKVRKEVVTKMCNCQLGFPLWQRLEELWHSTLSKEDYIEFIAGNGWLWVNDRWWPEIVEDFPEIFVKSHFCPELDNDVMDRDPVGEDPDEKLEENRSQFAWRQYRKYR